MILAVAVGEYAFTSKTNVNRKLHIILEMPSKKIEIITTGKLFLTMVHHDLNKFPQLVLENALLQVLPRFVV